MSKTNPPKIVAFPVNQLIKLSEELELAVSLSKTMIKWYAEKTNLEDWDHSAVPMLIEVYSTGQKVVGFIEQKVNEPTPEEQLVAEAMGMGIDSIPFMENELLLISQSIKLIDETKQTLKMKHGISYEVH